MSELANLHTVNGLHVDETRNHEEPSAADATRKLAYHVHITATFNLCCRYHTPVNYHEGKSNHASVCEVNHVVNI